MLPRPTTTKRLGRASDAVDAEAMVDETGVRATRRPHSMPRATCLRTGCVTAIRMEEIAEPYIRRRAMRHMEKGRVVLFAAGTGNPYFSTDTAAVLRAIEMESDVVIKATKVQGVYTADPVKDPSAEFIPTISFQEVVQRELAVMDAAAVALCKENDLPIIVLNLSDSGAVANAIRGERVGTLVS